MKVKTEKRVLVDMSAEEAVEIYTWCKTQYDTVRDGPEGTMRVFLSVLYEGVRENR